MKYSNIIRPTGHGKITLNVQLTFFVFLVSVDVFEMCN